MPLTKSARNRVITGVCGGIAEWLGWDPTAVRLTFILIAVLSGVAPGAVAYILLWLIMPAPRRN